MNASIAALRNAASSSASHDTSSPAANASSGRPSGNMRSESGPSSQQQQSNPVRSQSAGRLYTHRQPPSPHAARIMTEATNMDSPGRTQPPPDSSYLAAGLHTTGAPSTRVRMNLEASRGELRGGRQSMENGSDSNLRYSSSMSMSQTRAPSTSANSKWEHLNTATTDDRSRPARITIRGRERNE